MKSAAVLGICLSVGCGGATDPPAALAEMDTEVRDSSPVGDDAIPPIETAVDDSAATDTTATMDSTSCPPLGATATELWVDSRATKKGSGEKACPFRTIREALAVPKDPGVVRRVYVMSGTYVEDDVVDIVQGVLVIATSLFPSETPASAVLRGGSKANCEGVGDRCVVHLSGGLLSGFDIVASGAAYGVVSGAGGGSLNKVWVSGAARDGVVVLDGAKMLDVNVRSNGGNGVLVRGGTLKVGPGLWSSFESNAGSGVVVSGTATVDLADSFMRSNEHGILFEETSASTVVQTITHATIEANRANGVTVNRGQTKVVIRRSRLYSNARFGIYADLSSGLTLDLGTSIGAGENYFSSVGSMPPLLNGKAALFLCGASTAQPADGNYWTQCPMSKASVSTCTTVPSSYVDVAWTGVAAVPVTATACAVW